MTQATLYQVNPAVIGMTGAEAALFNRLLREWGRHVASNARNEAYYNARHILRNVDMGVPEQLKGLRTVCGWPAKAVDSLASRSVLNGFVSDGMAASDLAEVVQANDMRELYRQALTSELISSCSFLTVSRGLPGEPPVLVSAYSALNASAIWDERRKRIRAGIAVVDVTEDAGGRKTPSWVNMYTDEFTYVCRRMRNGRWSVDRAENPLGRPLMEPLRYRPTLDRPFGKSRISRAVRSITDEAVLATTNAAVAAVFYTYPQRYLLGVDRKTAETYAASKLEAYIDRMLMITANKNGDIPQYGQLAQMSMQPHSDYLQTLAKRFAGETSVPLNSLGIVFDNPSSAEAMYASQNDLIIEAEWLNAYNGAALRTVALMALAQLRGTDLGGLSDDDRSIEAHFENPQRPSMAARADFALKVASAVPEYAQTDSFWRDLGYEEAEIRSIRKELRYVNASRFLAQQQTRAGLPTATQQTQQQAGGQQPQQ